MRGGTELYDCRASVGGGIPCLHSRNWSRSESEHRPCSSAAVRSQVGAQTLDFALAREMNAGYMSM
eukprot:270928-Amphidinium_carterae.1